MRCEFLRMSVVLWIMAMPRGKGIPHGENGFITFRRLSTPFARSLPPGPGLTATIAWQLTMNNCAYRQIERAVYYGWPQALESLELTAVTPVPMVTSSVPRLPGGHASSPHSPACPPARDAAINPRYACYP